MLIIDGPDGAGKTTLCNSLQKIGIVEKVLESPRLVSGPNPDKLKYETDRYIRLYGRNNRVAVDRLLFSEMAYGPVMRGTVAFTRQEYLTRLLEIMLSGSIVIFCLPDKLNFKPTERPDYIANMDQVVIRYKALAEDTAFTNPKTYIYKWDEKNAFHELVKFIKENR